MIVLDRPPVSPIYGSYPDERSIEERLENGIIILDKPRGPTSHQVTSWVKEILELKKTGHSGTLDPNVSGVLVVG
ncbi:MAG TPA: RNA-guided pseudouridylation complex pseudouridine synthase subunit Cbf5, partial [Thermoplasmata archaeon]|nr:RNA-guided pseudouridylation complex pseudouridine synthase subunit Cbf5 [Thermoplasmata archaeon]